LQPQVVSTSSPLFSGSRSIHGCGHSDMTCLVLSMGRLLELYMWNRWPSLCASKMQMVSYATRRIAKVSAEAPHWQIIVKFWNTPIHQNISWSISFEARTKESLKELCRSHGPRRISDGQSGTRFEHKSIRLNPISFIPQGST